jgi:hypothetical protein
MLVYTEGETGEAWKPSKKAILFWKSGNIG